nr:EG45-like domain containing protein [Ipomoea batatas]
MNLTCGGRRRRWTQNRGERWRHWLETRRADGNGWLAGGRPVAGEMAAATELHGWRRLGKSATACFGSDRSQFPSSNYFAAAGEGIWDNGASCGRQYLVSCISSVLPKACKKDQTIQIKIVDRAQTSVSRPTKPGTTMVLSNAAFAAIADPSATSLNIEFQQ